MECSDQLINYFENFASLSEGDEALVLELWEERSLGKDDYFLREGQTCKHIAFIQKGLMRSYLNHEGEEKTFAFYQEKDFVSDYESFVPRSPSTKNIQALEDTQMLCINYDDLQKLYAQAQMGERMGRLIIEQVFIEVLRDLYAFYKHTPEQRYQHFLEKQPDLHERISQYYIASYVGVKPQSLSRIRNRIFRKS